MNHFLNKNRIIGFVYALFFSLFNMLGFIYRKKIVADKKDIIIFIIGFIVLTYVMFKFYYWFKSLLIKKFVYDMKYEDIKDNTLQIKYCIHVFVFHFVIYFIVFLAYFPGIFTYDVNYQVIQHYGTYNTHHPILHTLLLNFFIKLGTDICGDSTYGIALLSFVQIFISSLSFAIMHTYIYSKNSSIVLRKIMILFTALAPFFQILHLSMIKDSIFSSFFVLFILHTYIMSTKDDIKYNDNTKHRYVYPFIFVTLVMLLFRYNAMFTMCVYILILFIYVISLFLKKNMKKCKVVFYLMVISMISFLVACYLNNVININLLSIRDNQREMYSVPCVQLALVYNTKNELTENEKKEIKYCIDSVDFYNPSRADSLKEIDSINLDNNFMSIYLKYFSKYPFTYLKAYFLLNQGYYYILDTTSASIYGEGMIGEYGGAGYMLTDHHDLCGVRKAPIFKTLNKIYEWLFSKNMYQKILPLHIFMAFALYGWIIFLFFAYSIEDKVVNVPVYSFILLYIFMLTFGPCAIVRYALPYISVVPFIVFIYIDSLKSKV